jgi:hypothetical protein
MRSFLLDYGFVAVWLATSTVILTIGVTLGANLERVRHGEQSDLRKE